MIGILKDPAWRKREAAQSVTRSMRNTLSDQLTSFTAVASNRLAQMLWGATKRAPAGRKVAFKRDVARAEDSMMVESKA
jgi:hypothetical protein